MDQFQEGFRISGCWRTEWRTSRNHWNSKSGNPRLQIYFDGRTGKGITWIWINFGSIWTEHTLHLVRDNMIPIMPQFSDWTVSEPGAWEPEMAAAIIDCVCKCEDIFIMWDTAASSDHLIISYHLRYNYVSFIQSSVLPSSLAQYSTLSHRYTHIHQGLD